MSHDLQQFVSWWLQGFNGVLIPDKWGEWASNVDSAGNPIDLFLSPFYVSLGLNGQGPIIYCMVWDGSAPGKIVVFNGESHPGQMGIVDLQWG